MKQKLLKTLNWLRITDENGLLSLTHLAVFISIYKVATASTYSITEVTALLVAMLSYGYKRHVNRNKAIITDENKAAIQKIEQKLAQLADKQGAVAMAMGFKPSQK